MISSHWRAAQMPRAWAAVACATVLATIFAGGCSYFRKSPTTQPSIPEKTVARPAPAAAPAPAPAVAAKPAPTTAPSDSSSSYFPRLSRLWPFKHKEKKMATVTQSDFGKTKDGKPVTLFTLTNEHGLVAKIMTYGATLTELHVPDPVGNVGDVVLGFDNLADYEAHSPFFGATTGRVANRIAGGEFELNGESYQLAINNGPNTLHGGKVGFDKKIWTAKIVQNLDGPSVSFHYLSPDMEENFPGNLNVTVTYTLTNADDAIRIEYAAMTDKDTILNLTNHTYWNLSAFKSKTILPEIMYINADNYTPVDDNLIPTGKIRPVKGTVFDFTTPTSIGARIKQVPGGPPVGYDHNYVLNGKAGELKVCARVSDPDTGRAMEVLTTEPGVQFYTGNFLDGSVVGIGNVKYVQHAGFCLETQHFPDSIHHPNFPSTVLKPGKTYTQTTIYRFGTNE